MQNSEIIFHFHLSSLLLAQATLSAAKVSGLDYLTSSK